MARDYTSIEAYLSVVEVNREDWSNVIGECGPETTDLAPWMEPFMEMESMIAERVSVRLSEAIASS